MSPVIQCWILLDKGDTKLTNRKKQGKKSEVNPTYILLGLIGVVDMLKRISHF
ncbi:hypothetical protein [Acidianus sp. RZ1]|uniref:hypothetical protein n=1 Tax=Acidianus sp. RZ1 TaxID=1540082 RepID=UPI001492DC2B|nr:hypothetical protein [Acidianus sp. RZ1]NON62325.1 hypothetical protein [Acidianus sp. RZ1]